ncbi:hypothetical protein PGT21_012975 [Puccinia graminis f. sp. tritici]|uniref:Uncharacterized protein n=1 Tax=Puccinia graminis f. sp. tritici TaxID=56615 RepID=A0A5B0Q5Q4_PUCGR|nr:hypothetical protein PGT21_012975 [Puccinia graminis f. sp. tritici]
MYLASWKKILPAVKHVPRQLEGNPSSQSLSGPLKGGYPRIPARIPAKAGGYLLADADSGFPRKSSQISGCKAAISIKNLMLAFHNGWLINVEKRNFWKMWNVWEGFRGRHLHMFWMQC